MHEMKKMWHNYIFTKWEFWPKAIFGLKSQRVTLGLPTMAIAAHKEELLGSILRIQRIEEYLRQPVNHNHQLDLLQCWSTWSAQDKQRAAADFYNQYSEMSEFHGGTVACIWTLERTAPEFLQQQLVSKVSASRCLRGLYFKTRSEGVAELTAQWVCRAMLDHSHYMRRIYDLLESTFKHRHHVSWDNGVGIDLDALRCEIGTWWVFFWNAGYRWWFQPLWKYYTTWTISQNICERKQKQPPPIC